MLEHLQINQNLLWPAIILLVYVGLMLWFYSGRNDHKKRR